MFLFIGVLGGFTTFSSLGLETFNLFRDGEFVIAVLNLLITNIAGLALVYMGYGSSRYLLSLLHTGA
jgi:CrcB protein